MVSIPFNPTKSNVARSVCEDKGGKRYGGKWDTSADKWLWVTQPGLKLAKSATAHVGPGLLRVESGPERRSPGEHQ